MNTQRSHVRCYDRFANHKRYAAAALLMLAGAGASLACTGRAEAAGVQQLPRVVITGKAQKIEQLPRVVVAGKRTPDAVQLAANGQIRRVSLEAAPYVQKQSPAGI